MEYPYQRIIAEFQDRQQNVGLAVAVLSEGCFVFADVFGWADREAEVRATLETPFGIASVTKAFTGAALLKLYEEGRIDLDAEIQRYIPEFPLHPAASVTLRQLAAHLAGIRHWGPERNADLNARHFDDLFDILPLFRDNAFAVVPGTQYLYSSYGYNLLAMAIQRAAGIPFQQYVAQAILHPLQLQKTGFDRPGLAGRERPARYSWYDLTDYHPLDTAPVRVPDWDYSHNMAGGNMAATVGDLARFGRAFRPSGLLSDTSIALLWRRPVLAGIESPMSFGWFLRDDPPRLSISGSNAGLQAGMTVWRDQDLVVVALANSWGIGSQSGEFMDDSPQGLLGKLAAVSRTE